MKKMENQISSLTKDNSFFKEENIKLEKSISFINEKISDINKAHMNINEKISSMKEKISSLKEDCKYMKDEINDLIIHNEKTTKTIQKICDDTSSIIKILIIN